MRIVILTLVFGLVGCVPIPHYSNLTPEITGVIEQSGKPLENIPVRVVSGEESEHCEGQVSDVRTNEEGKFYLAPIEQFNFMSVIMAHSFFPWSVCAKNEESWVLLAKEKSYALADSGPMQKFEVQCKNLQPIVECHLNEVWR